jgi:formylglycine-generating enzyme required for sulfatase activity
MRSLILICLALLLAAPCARAATNPNAIAVIIGNKAYTGRDVPEVKYADRDAQAMKRYVIDVLGYDPENIIYVENAGLSRMFDLFGTSDQAGTIARWLRRDGSSDLFVYYSGHGVPGLSDGQSYLLPVDGNPEAGERNGYPLRLLYANLQKTRARNIVVLLDACFAGQSGNGASLIHNASLLVRPADPAPKQLIPRLTVLAASGANEVANWDDADRHGLFTEYFLRAVYGAADAAAGDAAEKRITVAAVHRYLDNQMTYFAGRRLGRDQNASVSGDDSLVLATFASSMRPVRPDVAPSPSPAVPVMAPIPAPAPQSPSPPIPAPPLAAATLKECANCPQMVLVPAGSFEMGVPEAEPERESSDDDDARPVHTVRIGQPFYLGKYHVTRGEYAAFAKATGRKVVQPGFDQTDDHPVVDVSWEDAQAYVAWLSRTTGKPYRLPTEAEWEYAARAGTVTARYWGDSADQQCLYANGDDAAAKCSDGFVNTSPVGHFVPNRFGLHDMLGNTWQWVQDCHEASGYRGASSDGSAHETVSCSSRVLRGGSWFNDPGRLRAGFRVDVLPTFQFYDVGFRVARTFIP